MCMFSNKLYFEKITKNKEHLVEIKAVMHEPLGSGRAKVRIKAKALTGKNKEN